MVRDIRGAQLRDAANEQFRWRHEIRAQVVSPDIDGLMSAALLHELYGWPIVGSYDTKTLWLSADATTPLDLRRVAWVDLDMTWPGCRCLSQHVTLRTAEDAITVQAFQEAVNPSILRRHNASSAAEYRGKYPFGTFQWLWWIHHLDVRTARLDTPEGRGLAWMPDGGFDSVQGVWRDNCLDWACKIMPGSLMDAVLGAGMPHLRDQRIRKLPEAVRAAEAYLRRESGIEGSWINHQWRYDGRRPFPEVADEAQALLDALCRFYSWAPVELPRRLVSWSGQVRTSDRRTPTPDFVPAGSTPGVVVSSAAVGNGRFRWTEASDAHSASTLRSLRQALRGE